MTKRSDAPRLTIREITFHERDVTLRLPFRFGVVTLTESPQAYARVRLADENGNQAWGMAAELLAPKWFDKNLKLSNEDNFNQLRAALHVAAALYQGAGTDTAFGLFAACYAEQVRTCGARDLNSLVAGYGPALIDRAVLDALCRLKGASFFEAMRTNLPGIAPAVLLPEFDGFDMDGFLARLSPADRIHARHTVGMVDPLTAADRKPEDRVNDGLPETLEEVVTDYGHRYFKLKVGGNLEADIGRLGAIAAVLDTISEPYFATLDGNEQYMDVDGILALWREMKKTPALDRLNDSIMMIEQPINRKTALSRDIGLLAAEKPVIIDESDADLNAFAVARGLGYAGISSKSCKGIYKSLINAARCARWNAEEGNERYFMSAEDLTIQAGVSLQQDLALATLIGVTHIERNGHHYVNGMARLPEEEQAAFLAAHPDLYHRSDGVVRLKITAGRIALGSLHCPGFAVAAEPHWADMRPMPEA